MKEKKTTNPSARRKTGFGEAQNNGVAKRFSPEGGSSKGENSIARKKTGFNEAQNNGVAKRFQD